jgi:hypothetical protein
MSFQTQRAAKVNDVKGPIHVDGYLTSFSLSYRQGAAAYISGMASTSISVLKESDKYVVYPRGYMLRDEAQVRPLGGRPAQVNQKLESDNYNAEEWALETTLDDRQRSNTDQPINLEEGAIMTLETKQLIREDRIWCERFFRTGVWTFEEIGVTDFTPFNDASSTPISVIENLKLQQAQSTGIMPNTLVLGANVRSALKNNPDMLDRIKYTQRGVVTDDLLAALFELESVKTPMAIYNAALEGSDDDFEFICDPNAMWLGYIAPNGGLNIPTAIARFGWTGLIPGAATNQGGVITRGRDDRAYSDWFHSRNAFDLKLVAPDLGMFISDAVVPVSN